MDQSRTRTAASARAVPNFPREEELVADLAVFLSKTSGNRFRVLAEHEGGFGRPDLLLYSNGRRRAQDAASLATINPRLAPLLAPAAAARIDSIDGLALATGVSQMSARKIARHLFDLGRLRDDPNTSPTIRIIPIAKPPFPQVVAIEAKLRDWRRALVQAYRYRQFSTESWVVLDHHRIGRRGRFLRSCPVSQSPITQVWRVPLASAGREDAHALSPRPRRPLSSLGSLACASTRRALIPCSSEDRKTDDCG